MRERSTWNLQEIAIARKAADKRAAEVAGDIYSMNQDHPQPAMDEYVIGDPSDFAEDVHEPNTWEAEYANGQTKRNEIGMPDMRKDTFNHAEKTASDKVRLKKAELCVAVAKLMLRGTKTASVDAIEDQAFALMFMPDQELINTHKRLAAEQEQEEEEAEEEAEDDAEEEAEEEAEDDDDDGVDKQAGEIPEAFKENIEKMKAKAEDKDDGEGQDKKAGDVPDFIQEKIDEKKEKDEGEKKSAKSKSKTSDQALKEPKNEGGNQNAKANDNWKSANGQQQYAQMQEMVAQLQQMIQQAQGQQEQLAQGQQQIPQQVGQQQAPAPEAPVMAQGDELDQMLAQDDIGPMAEVDIELDPAPMDVDNVVLAGEDEILRTLFAQDEQGDEGGEEEQQAQQQVQAAVRTASTRTVGTRPTAGVSKLGGSVSKTASLEADKLSALWQSAPDVRDAFGLK